MIECVIVVYIYFERSSYEEIANAKATCGKYNNYVLDKKRQDVKVTWLLDSIYKSIGCNVSRLVAFS